MFKRKEAQITRKKKVLIEGLSSVLGTHRAVVVLWAQLTALLAPL